MKRGGGGTATNDDGYDADDDDYDAGPAEANQKEHPAGVHYTHFIPLLIISPEGVLRQWLWENKLLEDFLIRAVIRAGVSVRHALPSGRKQKRKGKKAIKLCSLFYRLKSAHTMYA